MQSASLITMRNATTLCIEFKLMQLHFDYEFEIQGTSTLNSCQDVFFTQV